MGHGEKQTHEDIDVSTKIIEESVAKKLLDIGRLVLAK